jgi:hypothetical protein
LVAIIAPSIIMAVNLADEVRLQAISVLESLVDAGLISHETTGKELWRSRDAQERIWSAGLAYILVSPGLTVGQAVEVLNMWPIDAPAHIEEKITEAGKKTIGAVVRPDNFEVQYRIRLGMPYLVSRNIAIIGGRYRIPGERVAISKLELDGAYATIQRDLSRIAEAEKQLIADGYVKRIEARHGSVCNGLTCRKGCLFIRHEFYNTLGPNQFVRDQFVFVI